jgi:hypothetical protein
VVIIVLGIINIGKTLWSEDALPLLLGCHEVRHNAGYQVLLEVC